MVEMKVEGLTLDPLTNMPIIILKDLEGNRALPIWVGFFEANAIALEIEKIVPQRPMTHDLLRNFILEMGYEVSKIVITDLKDNTFYAQIVIEKGDETAVFDARPSDAIALALRSDCPIFVDSNVFELSNAASEQETAEGEESEEATEDDWPEVIN